MSLTTPISLSTILQRLSALDMIVDSTNPSSEDRTISMVSADNRQIGAGGLFVAVLGDIVDGHRYVAAAIQAGAVAVIGTYTVGELATRGVDLPEGVTYIQTTNSRRALAEASAALYGFPSRDLVVIGVTGTDGKTTTCTLLESILAAATRTEDSSNGRVGVITTVGVRICGQEQETGFHVTTPDAPEVQRYLAQIRDAGCDYAIVESTSHGLAQNRVAAVEYDVAAVTNITHEHLDYHGTREAYLQAKALLYRVLFDGAIEQYDGRFAVLNVDDEGSFAALTSVMAEETERHGPAVKTYAYAMCETESERADVCARNVRYSPVKTIFEVQWQGGSFDVVTHLIGQFNVQNILCAASIALGLGIDPSHVHQGVAQLQGISGRMERIVRGQDFLAIVDFAHSPVSLERALQTLRALVRTVERDRGQLIAVFGSAGLRDRAKRRLMGQVSGRLADFTVITAEDPRTEEVAEINREIESGLLEFAGTERYIIIPDRAQAIQYAVDLAEAGDVVAAFGKGHERSMCFGTTEYPWSDQQAMADALDARRSH